MALNKVILSAQVAFNDIETKGDEGKEYAMFQVNVQRDYKPEGEQYYPTDTINCKAFKAQAKFLGDHFKKGDYLIIEGSLRKDDNYEKDGQMVYGQLYVLVEKVFFAPKGSNSDNQSTPVTGGNKPSLPGAKPGAKPSLKPKARFNV